MSLKNDLTEVTIDLLVVLIVVFMALTATIFMTAVRYFIGFLIGTTLIYFGVPPAILEIDTGVLFGVVFVIIGFLKPTKT